MTADSAADGRTRVAAGKRRQRPIVSGPSAGLATLVAKLGRRAKIGERLAEHTTFGIGGPADLFTEARSRDELMELVQLAQEQGVPCLVIGSGANLLVADKGVRGLVIQNSCERVEFSNGGDGGEVLIEADSGCLLREVARESVRRGLSGLEWAVDVPGTVGGAVVGNAGAYGGYMADCLTRALVFDPASGARWWTKAELQLDYRTSYFKERYAKALPSPIVLAAELKVRSGDTEQIRAIAEKNTRRRKEAQPAGKSAGSVFKRTQDHPAGYLIEQAGLKGTRIGGAVVSTQHANFIVNEGAASAEDVRRLIELVRETVYERFQTWLELEIQLVGEW